MKPFLVLDIETAPLDESRLREITPAFKANGTLKDPEKIKVDLANKEADWLAESALTALRGQILCVGFLDHEGVWSLFDWAECELVKKVISIITENWTSSTLVGHNLFQFDLPFLCRRAFHHGIEVPGFLKRALRGFHPPDEIFDTMLEWRMSNREERISLDNLAWHLGVGRKNGSGADFAKLWTEDRPKAVEYLHNDLKLTKACFEKMISTAVEWPRVEVGE